MKIKLLGLSGSFRKGSYNTALLHAVAGALPSRAGLIIHDYTDVPLYNQDLDSAQPPAGVERLRQAIHDADGLLIATPEYNHGIPGTLKNAIDWASRPAFQSSLTGKPVAVLSASMSPVGGARVQSVLRQVLGGTISPLFPHIEMLIAAVHKQFDANGVLVNEKTGQRLEKFVGEYVQWIEQHRTG